MRRNVTRWLAILCATAMIFGSNPTVYAAETADPVEEVTTVQEQKEEEKTEEKTEEKKEEKKEESKQEEKKEQETEEKPAASKEETTVKNDTEESVKEDAEPEKKEETVDQAEPDQNKDTDTQKTSDDKVTESTSKKKTGTVSIKAGDTMTFDLTGTFTYNGSAFTPEPTNVKVKDGDNWVTLTTRDQYTVTYANNINAGKGTVTVTGAAGTKYETCTLSKTFTINKANQTLQATASKPSVKYSKKGKINVSGAQGTVTYASSNKKVVAVNKSGEYKGKVTGKANITVTAAGNANYNSAKKVVTITVTGKKLTSKTAKIKLSKTKYTYNGKKKKPKVTVKYKGKTLKKGKDYKLSYTNNKDAGKAKAVITGMGKYEGTVKKSYKIKKAANTMKVTLADKTVDPGDRIAFKVKKAVGTVTYTSSNTKIATVSNKGVITGKTKGKVTITVKAAGNKNYKSKTKKFKLLVGYHSLKSEYCKITLDETSYTYDGKEKEPEVTVKFDGKKLKLKTDYTVTYKNNKNAGTASVIVTGKGTYMDSVTVNFKIKKANQDDMKVSPTSATVAKGQTIKVSVYNAVGNVTFSTGSPSWLKNLGGGSFKALQTTKNYVTITVTAAGNQNYNKKSITIKVRIY